jgi:hypothetical protein
MESRRAYLKCLGCRLHHNPILTVLDQYGFHLCRELAYRDLAGQLQHSGLLPSRFPGAKSDPGSLRSMVSRRLLRRRSWWSRYCIRWQYLVSLLTLEWGNLGGSHTKRRPTRPPQPNASVAARFIHENKVFGREIRNII